jgi:hypothetical protein
MKFSKILTVICLLISTFCFCQKNTIDSLFIQFKKPSFYQDTYPAKKKLESYQKQILPKLIELLSDTTFVKLTGTADLIYPGADKFYGHGHYIPYDMDWISVRAGWLLENLTFQDFGYKTTNIGNLNWKDKLEGEKIKEFRKLRAEKVKKWWNENKKKWNRLESIKEALISEDVNRISNAVQFLRFGETQCDGLNSEVFLKEIKPLALKLRDSKMRT